MWRPCLLGLGLAVLPVRAWAEEPDEGEVEPADPAPSADPAPPAEASSAGLHALQAELATLRRTVATQQERLDALHADLSTQKRRLGALEDVQIDLEGYYRTRAYAFPRLNNGQERDPRFMDMRLRMRPVFDYKGLAKAVVQIDALDNTVWGDNNGLAQTPIFAGSPTNDDRAGQPQPSIAVTRAWLEATLPIGSLRAGRMASHWGLGLLANDGNGFDDTFGENRAGATFDRVMFATRPVAIAQALMGREDSGLPLYTVVAVDRLVEDPLTQYYGYQCDAGLTKGVDDDYDVRCDPNGDGYTDIEHDYTEDRDPTRRGQTWWADQDDDVAELVLAVVYRGEDLKLVGTADDLTVGGYLIHRWQKETDSDVLIGDVWIDADLDGFVFEFEGLHIGGRSRGLVLPGAYDPSGQIADPLRKQVDIWSYVGRTGYRSNDLDLLLEHGFASGDDNVADERFTGRALDPDHNVGLLLYDEVLARVTAQAWSNDARPLWSQGGVVNSRYVFPHAIYRPLDDVQLIGAFLMAWPHKPDGSTILCREGEGCAQSAATARALGWEIDLAAKITLHEHVLFSLEGGFAQATDRLPLAAAGLDENGTFVTLQSRLAYAF